MGWALQGPMTQPAPSCDWPLHAAAAVAVTLTSLDLELHPHTAHSPRAWITWEWACPVRRHFESSVVGHFVLLV